MADSIKINKLEIENVKRIKAVKIEPTKNGLTIVGGNNNQGKTSVLDSIAWALGGDRYKPSNATRDGSTIPPNLHIVMSNGLVVERKGKNSSLKVTDPNGNKGGQQLLNDFVEQLALDLPKFMESSGKEKAQTLLKIIGVGDQLTALEQQEKELYNERLYVGRTADQKVKFAKEQPYYPDAPKDLVSPSDLIKQQQEILARNGKNEEYRRNAVNMKAEYDSLNMEIENLRKMLQEKMERHEALSEALEAANKTVSELHDESTAELEASIANIEEINRKVRANLDKDKAEEDAKAYQDQYNELTKKIEDVRDQKTELLNAADLPLPELSVKEGELVYKGQQWDNMSGSDRLKVSTAIVRKLNPKCGFVLLDKLEQMDLVTLNEFGQWLEQEGFCEYLDAIAYISVGESDTQTLGTLSVTSEAGSEAGDTKLTVKEQLLSPRNCWKYKDAAAATSVTYGMDVKNWSKWDGESEIASTAGHHITLVECDQNYKAVRSGDVAVTVNPGA